MSKLYDRADIYDLIDSEKRTEIGYGNVEIRPVPCEIPETDMDRIDWYRMIAQKQ